MLASPVTAAVVNFTEVENICGYPELLTFVNGPETFVAKMLGALWSAVTLVRPEPLPVNGAFAGDQNPPLAILVPPIMKFTFVLK